MKLTKETLREIIKEVITPDKLSLANDGWHKYEDINISSSDFPFL